MNWLKRITGQAAALPAPYLLFSFGITRSGSTLAYQMARVALELAGGPQPMTKRGKKTLFVPRLDRKQIDPLWSAAQDLGHPIAVKLHNGPREPAETMLRDGTAKAHVILRDPRDIALSLRDRGARARLTGAKGFADIHSLADAKHSIDKQMPMLLRWLRQPEILVLSYDALAFDGAATLRLMLDHMQIDGKPDRILRTIFRRKLSKPVTARRDRYLADMTPADQDWFLAAYRPFYDRVLGHSTPDLTGIDDLKSPDCDRMIAPPSESE